MVRRQIRWALLAVAAAAVIAAVAIAVTRSGHTSSASSAAAIATRGAGAGDFAAAAAYLGVSEAQLRRELRGGKTLGGVAAMTRGRSATGLVRALVDATSLRLDAAVRAGKLTKAQASTRLADARRRSEVEVRTAGPLAIGGVHYLAVSTRYLAVSAGRLREARRSGRSLGELADSLPGKSAKGLVDALVAARAADLQSAVSAHSLSLGQERKVLAGVRMRIALRVARKPRHH